MCLGAALLGTKKDQSGRNHGNSVMEKMSKTKRVVGLVADRDPVSEVTGSVLEPQGSEDHVA